MGVELFLVVVAKSSMLANLTHTDIVLLHAHTTHTHTQGISEINSTQRIWWG